MLLLRARRSSVSHLDISEKCCVESDASYVDMNGKSSSISKADFKILKVIGRGSFGKVYLVQKIDNQ